MGMQNAAGLPDFVQEGYTQHSLLVEERQPRALNIFS